MREAEPVPARAVPEGVASERPVPKGIGREVRRRKGSAGRSGDERDRPGGPATKGIGREAGPESPVPLPAPSARGRGQEARNFENGMTDERLRHIPVCFMRIPPACARPLFLPEKDSS